MLSHHIIIPSAHFPQAFNKLGLLTPRAFSIGEASEAQSAQGRRTRQHQGPDLDSLERLYCKCGTTRTAHTRCEGTSSPHGPTAPPRQGACGHRLVSGLLVCRDGPTIPCLGRGQPQSFAFFLLGTPCPPNVFWDPVSSASWVSEDNPV